MRRVSNATNHIVICTFYTYNFERNLKISVNITFEKKSLRQEHGTARFLLVYISNHYIKNWFSLPHQKQRKPVVPMGFF